MGFLTGVLSNIQGHLGQHNGQINEAIEALNKNKHGGKKGFNIAIGKVVEGVRGYNDGVMKSNNKVSEPIRKFYDYTNYLIEAIGMFNDHNDINQMNNKVGECLEWASDYVETMKGEHEELESSVILGETLRNVFSRVYHRKEIFPMSLGGVLKAKSVELKRQHREAKGGHTGALDRRTRYQWRAHKKCS
ncbi:hypothetical protein, conserved [Babesia bigemina]|uniref:Uncharacterized protein n=1 Tax=Babesia bigemina TaxID=5866 RepID=A0A061BKE6_BABBI|nr:hypothetical protein, conserved [Babesia bigemina]CDR71912.1 hypothetical protein, conserved [Babesia bigemina]|eukprot:XP_012770854.1 hypothetical protein, conserved [Babesia bigemina]